MIDISKIIQIESSGNPDAISYKGALGLMQITKSVLKDWNNLSGAESYVIDDLYNPEINKKIGEWYINERIPEMLKSYSIPDCDIFRCIAYNWGIGHLKQWFEMLPDETRNYIKKYEQLSPLEKGLLDVEINKI